VVLGGGAPENVLQECSSNTYLEVGCVDDNHFCSAIKQSLSENVNINITILLRKMDNFVEDGIDLNMLEELIIGVSEGLF
jgi:hypothetical protein